MAQGKGICVKKKTKKYLITKIYNHQKDSCKKRGMPLPTYSKDELYDFMMSSTKFHILYDNWKRLDFQKNYTPSIDRKNDLLSYTLQNIQIVTWESNYRKAHLFHKLGINSNNTSKKVLQYSKDNVFIKEFHSCMEAHRITGIERSTISKCAQGKRKSAGCFLWKFKEEVK